MQHVRLDLSYFWTEGSAEYRDDKGGLFPDRVPRGGGNRGVILDVFSR